MFVWEWFYPLNGYNIKAVRNSAETTNILQQKSIIS